LLSFLKIYGERAEVGTRAGAEIFDKLEPEQHKIRPAHQHCIDLHSDVDHG
jgi:hypothetical protein